MFLSVGYIILDDIVFPNGRTRMATLGGGVTHAATGMRIWEDSVGLASALGRDFPLSVREDLARCFDLRALTQSRAVTPHFWQLYEEDGRRTEVFRTNLNEMLSMVAEPTELRVTFPRIQGAYLDCEAPDYLRAWIRFLRKNGKGVILWEPWERYCLPKNRTQIRELSQEVDVLALSLPEARTLSGKTKPAEIVAQLLAEGAHIVLLRMGEHGSLVANRQGEFYEIPAYPVEQIVDVTGAGNAYCGGFLVGLAKTGNLRQAGVYGAISASLVIERSGALLPFDAARVAAKERFEFYENLA